MYQNIEKNIESILKINDSLYKHFADYISLLELVNNKNEHFPLLKEDQLRFRSFWSMNVAMLNEDFYNTYFNLVNINTPLDALRMLHDEHNKYQYSFSTKFYHTFINTKAPIYDSRVKLFYLLPDASPANFEGQYNWLVSEYDRILNNNLLEKSITRVREEFNLTLIVTNEKIIDSLIWAYVNAMQKRNLVENEFEY